MHYLKFTIEDEALIMKESKKHTEEFDVQKDLPSIFDPNECCYAVVDLKFQISQGGDREKLMFISWAPDTARVKQKMLHSSSKASVIAKLEGIFASVQATDASEVTFEAVLAAAQAKMTTK